jgi:hypothetical protein
VCFEHIGGGALPHPFVAGLPRVIVDIRSMGSMGSMGGSAALERYVVDAVVLEGRGDQSGQGHGRPWSDWRRRRSGSRRLGRSASRTQVVTAARAGGVPAAPWDTGVTLGAAFRSPLAERRLPWVLLEW